MCLRVTKTFIIFLSSHRKNSENQQGDRDLLKVKSSSFEKETVMANVQGRAVSNLGLYIICCNSVILILGWW